MIDPQYDLFLVIISIAIAVFASYVALDLAERLSTVSGRAKWAWLSGGSVAMGVGIWSMHFVGMLACHLPVPVTYDIPLLILSVVVAIAASALFDLGREEDARRLLDALVASCLNPGEGDGVLLHCCYRQPIGHGLDCATVWGDFFLLDALMRAEAPERRLDPLA